MAEHVPLRLEELSAAHAEGYRRMVREAVEAQGSYPHNDGDLALRDFEAFLAARSAQRDGLDLAPDVDRQISYVALNDTGDVVGEFRFRPWKAEPFATGGGHLGCNIAHRFRRHGYATAGLRALLSVAADFGLPAVVFGIDETNAGSLAAARANGAELLHREDTTLWFRCATGDVSA